MNTAPKQPTFSDKLQQFLFAEEIPYGMAMLRILLPLVLLQGVLDRWRFCEELFSTNGVTVSLWENFGWYNWLQPMPPFWTACFYSILVVTLITASIGWQTRFSLIAAVTLHTYFACNDVATSMTKFTVIATHAMLLLSLSGCGRIWSVDSWLAGCRQPDRAPLSEHPDWAKVPVWPQRLLLFMVGITYLGAAITKLHMPEFITGDAIAYWIMSNPNFRHAIGEWMTQYPGFLVISGHFTVLWEILFLFLCWQGFQRKWMFGLGIFFHFMAALTLGEITFLMIMSSCYLGCLTASEYESLGAMLGRLRHAFARRVPRINWTTPFGSSRLFNRIGRFSPRVQAAAFCGLLLTVGLGGAWANQRLDLYGTKRPEGPYALQEIDQAEVQRLFAPPTRIRETDKFLGIKVGSIVVGGRLSNRCDDFRFGDVIICEASLNPPHEDMWVECHLLGSDRKLINRDGVLVAREHKWAQFQYKLTEALEPGEYTLVVRSRGQEICRRPFRLGLETAAPVAD